MLFKVVRLGNSGKKFKKVSCALSTQPFEYLNIFKVDFSVVTTKSNFLKSLACQVSSL